MQDQGSEVTGPQAAGTAESVNSPVLFSVDEQTHIGRLTLNRPENRNSMTAELLDAFSQASEQARVHPTMRVLVVTGTGPCFSSGADFRAIVQREDTERVTLAHERSFAMYAPFLSLRKIEVPIVGALNGHAVGGGFGLALSCDLRVAAEHARYGANFARLGLHPGLGIGYLLPRLIGLPKASELLFTGKLIDGRSGERLGLMNKAVPASEVLAESLALALEIAKSAPLAVRSMKRMMLAQLGWDVERAAMEEAMAQAATLQTDDVKEGIAALLEKREPHFLGR
jgi:enoyl-CoA hydratase/carnithine racemase